MCGNLSRVTDGFMCRRCDGTIQKADLSEGLMVDGVIYGCVKSFCYLGDTLDGDGGAGHERSSVCYLCQKQHDLWKTRPLLVDVVLKFERADMQMIRWMCAVSMKDRRTSVELKRMVGVEPITTH